MSSVLVDQLRALARRLGGSSTGRSDLTRRFWLIARQLRAALPPLLPATRTGSLQRRVGYLYSPGSESQEELEHIRRAHADFDESVTLYLQGDLRPLPAISWARALDMNPLNEIQAARAIAEQDLDLIVDVRGGTLQSMPLLVAMHPARKFLEPAFEPAATGAHPEAIGTPTPMDDIRTLLNFVRETLDGFPPLQAGNAESPAKLNARLNRGIQMHQAGELIAARGVYEDVLAHDPQHAIAAYLVGQLLFQQQDLEGAIARLQAATLAAPEFRDAHYTLAQRLADAGRWHQAVIAYRRALDLTPGFAAGWSGLGLASLHTLDGVSRGATDYLERAVALEPDVAQWSFNLGSGLQQSADLGGAREAYRRAVELDPGHNEARFNLAAVAQELGEFAQAVDGYRRVLERNASFEFAYVQLGAALLQSGRIEEWLENFRQYCANCAESLSMAVYGLEASVAAGDPASHASWCGRILAGAILERDADDFTRNWEQLLFLLLHVDVERGALLECYRRYDAIARQWYGKPLETDSSRRPGPLRIGYLSGDLRDHVMGRMIFEIVSRHDRQRFQPFFYSLGMSEDGWTDRFRALGSPFVQLARLTHKHAAERIRDDAIDVLVDCSGHTRGAQQGILALKPARVVATHIATPGPVGLRTIDYKLSDEHAESEDAQQYLIERLWPVKGGVFPWHRSPQPELSARTTFHISEEAFICGAFVSLMKLSPRCLALWRRVLERIPRAVLALSPAGEGWHASYLRWLEAHRIPRERVVFLPYHRDERAALGRYTVLDVALDPLPCGNVNGTMEALGCGVPVVTLAGRRHGERLGNALLNRFGVIDTIARDADEYVELVFRLATDCDWRNQVRARIRQAGIDSPVWNTAAYTRELEAAFERMTSAHEQSVAER